MEENEKDQNKTKSPKQPNAKKSSGVKGLDINRAEYEEIILSNSNHPEKSFYKNYE